MQSNRYVWKNTISELSLYRALLSQHIHAQPSEKHFTSIICVYSLTMIFLHAHENSLLKPHLSSFVVSIQRCYVSSGFKLHWQYILNFFVLTSSSLFCFLFTASTSSCIFINDFIHGEIEELVLNIALVLQYYFFYYFSKSSLFHIGYLPIWN